MNGNFSTFRTPAQLIEALLREKGWTNRVFALVLGLDEATTSRIVNGKRDVDAALAVALEEALNVPAEHFLELQQSYDLAQARLAAPHDPVRELRAHLFGKLPIAEMIKRGWIHAKDVRDPLVQSELVRFFGVNRIEDIEILPHAAKKTDVKNEPTPVQLAWLYRVKKIAGEMLVARYSHEALLATMPRLKQLLLSPEEARKVPRLLAECGVRFLIVESLPSAKIDGVCFWLNEKSPVIALSMRFDRIDNFWFVLRHEIEHVLQEHGKTRIMLDADLEGEDSLIDEEEAAANQAAAEFCVPQSKMNAFIARKAPFFYERDILAFAKMINVHPGLIAGQIRRRTNRYDRFGNYLVKVRASVLPSSISDGWGNVYPIEQ
ncbi:HTH-type transcriptional regulator/antitoxin HigA [Rhodopseudomonas thermotolerans]|uniref:HTH-type transcriptional regulator/antitoxin HigA n=2 Tax=Rhodopseudomonas TaxID=1073 RepID=A0A336JPA4_9BRAD|nr:MULTISPECIES: ImmA/IrrE family metallo-endopeptidase [Rhodopseudomonas]RED41984.1 HTH-type transcriptional regulator/antitoxin HigA [Rhodopseudomonas pentothenatexigens]REG07445.1 HTH-type transcriptional regulator/antitoxin HigA [Rhodopseudomonas thermotolerans]SSW89344.1 HTH-type transcriptional regulator/antitoxin HigA [Rhodopseudomonas pentothenatexigens]